MHGAHLTSHISSYHHPSSLAHTHPLTHPPSITRPSHHRPPRVPRIPTHQDAPPPAANPRIEPLLERRAARGAVGAGGGDEGGHPGGAVSPPDERAGEVGDEGGAQVFGARGDAGEPYAVGVPLPHAAPVQVPAGPFQSLRAHLRARVPRLRTLPAAQRARADPTVAGRTDPQARDRRQGRAARIRKSTELQTRRRPRRRPHLLPRAQVRRRVHPDPHRHHAPLAHRLAHALLQERPQLHQRPHPQHSSHPSSPPPTTPPFTTAILEGELLAYSTSTASILPFHHLRAHIHRAGTYIGAPPRDRSSHLMVVLFDVLLVDGASLLHQPYRVRLQHLRRTEVDFGVGDGAVEALRGVVCEGCGGGWEGVVMKPLEGAYVALDGGGGGGGDGNGRSYGHVGGREAWVKVKKDYMAGCGDTGDFAVVGARAEGARGWRLGVGTKALTVFHVGCLTNKGEVKRGRAKPRSRLVFEVCYSVPRHDLEEINRLAPFRTVAYDPATAPFTLDPLAGVTPPTHLFPTPLVFELTGGGFEKHANTPYYVLRHPRVCKVYFERDYLDAMTLEELQDAARAAEALSCGEREEEAVERAWVERLMAAERGGLKRAWSEGVGEGEGRGVVGLRRAVTDGGVPVGAGLVVEGEEEEEGGKVKRAKREVSLEPVEQNATEQKTAEWEIAEQKTAEIAPEIERKLQETSPPPALVEGNDQKSGISETAEGANVAAAEKQHTTPTRTPKPAGQPSSDSVAAAISPVKEAAPPPPVLREISPTVNPQGRRRSSGGNTPPKRGLVGSAAKEFGLSKNTAGNAPMATVLENDENQQPKTPVLKSTPSQLIEQQLIHEQRVQHQRAHSKPPPIPNCATTPPEASEALELKNGHSRISPLLNATVLLPHYLFKFPELTAKITAHKPAAVHALPAAAGDIPPLMPASKRCVVLVEPNKTSLTKKTLKGLAAAAGAVEGGYGFEVYDWRVAGKVQPEGGVGGGLELVSCLERGLSFCF